MTAVWYKRYPSDFLNGVADLSAEERGIYACLIDMMYDQGASIVDDPARLARRCGCSTRRFNQVKNRLIEDGKLIHREGRLFNKRVYSSLKPEFISELSLKYLVLIFPEINKFKGLTRSKIQDPRIHKKINKKKDQEGAGDGIEVPAFEPPIQGSPLRHLYNHVVAAHGEAVWWAWFRPGQATLIGTTLRPRTKFIHSRIIGNYEDALINAGVDLGEVQ